MAHYVVGFMFSPALAQVVLIRKDKPDWQKGKLNGVGGKVELQEPAREAMAREFLEETALKTWPENWLPVARLDNGSHGPRVTLDVFACWNASYEKVQTVTAEPVSIFDFWNAVGREDKIPNLEWLIPLCRHALKQEDWNRLDMPGAIV